MEVSELIKKVRRVEIKARGLSREIFSGQYHSAFKGRGMLFSEVREYVFGDDIRNIEWNVTARFGHPYVKVFEEERELCVMLLLDLSGSAFFGTQGTLRQEVITEIAAVLSFAAITNNDKVGLIIFTNQVEVFIPPRKGKTHVLRIIRELLDFTPKHAHTRLDIPLRFLSNAIKKKCTAFLISDFMTDTPFQDALKIASRKHDLMAIRLLDPIEKQLPDAGMVKIWDEEAGAFSWLDTSHKKTREEFRKSMQALHAGTFQLMRLNGVDFGDIELGQDHFKALNQLFRKRESKR